MDIRLNKKKRNFLGPPLSRVEEREMKKRMTETFFEQVDRGDSDDDLWS